MARKKKGPGDETASVSDQTASLTASEIQQSEAMLLGDGDLKRLGPPRALIKINSHQISPELNDVLEVPLKLNDTVGERVLVLGPYSIDQIKAWTEKSWLRPQDQIMISFDRWKTVKVHFPQLMKHFSEDFTDTATVEHTSSLPADPSILEVEAMDDPRPQNSSAEAGSDKVVFPPLENFVGSAQQVDSRASVSQAAQARRATPLPAVPKSTSSGISLSTRAWTLGIAALVVGAYFIVGPKKIFQEVKNETFESSLDAGLQRKALNWPDTLRPQEFEALLSDENPHLRRLKPILFAYERGNTYLSSADEQTLRALSDPASSSWEARRIASNQLAAFSLAKLRVEEARRILQPVIEAAPNDPTTLLNDALIRLAEGDTAGAFESASTGTRLSPPGLLWMAYSILGYVQSSAGRSEDAEKSFESALSRSPGNPMIVGLWLQGLGRGDFSKKKVLALVKEGLWMDPDKNMDSPLKAPLAGHMLFAESSAGYKKAADYLGRELSPGQSAFLRYQDSRIQSNPLGETLAKASSLLAGESDPNSQFLYAYLLNEESKVEQAADALTRLIPLIEDQKNVGSFPWTFAGDLQFARGQMNQAVIFYQTALRRNPQDPSAVLGLALSLREASDYAGAEQKLEEALSLDPNFIPALLRIGRLDWHRRARSQ